MNSWRSAASAGAGIRSIATSFGTASSARLRTDQFGIGLMVGDVAAALGQIIHIATPLSAAQARRRSRAEGSTADEAMYVAQKSGGNSVHMS